MVQIGLTTYTLFVGGALYMGVPFSYYYIDDVSVYPADAPVYVANAGSNVSICPGDSVQLGTTPHPQYLYSWNPSKGLRDSTIANPFVKPSVTTTYYLKQKDFKFTETTSSVTVSVGPCFYFNVYPSLVDNTLYIEYRNIEINKTHFVLFDICGRKVKDIPLAEPADKIEIDISSLAGGMYLYELIINNGINYPGKIVVEMKK
jgi:hypothetical protein